MRSQKHPEQSELEARIASYELAFRMQAEAPGAIDLAKETEATKQLYGIDETSSENGKTVKSVYRLDTISDKTWRVSSKPFVASGDLQNSDA